jgi:hypothetical protein
MRSQRRSFFLNSAEARRLKTKSEKAVFLKEQGCGLIASKEALQASLSSVKRWRNGRATSTMGKRPYLNTSEEQLLEQYAQIASASHDGMTKHQLAQKVSFFLGFFFLFLQFHYGK